MTWRFKLVYSLIRKSWIVPSARAKILLSLSRFPSFFLILLLLRKANRIFSFSGSLNSLQQPCGPNACQVHTLKTPDSWFYCISLQYFTYSIRNSWSWTLRYWWRWRNEEVEILSSLCRRHQTLSLPYLYNCNNHISRQFHSS